MAPPSERMADSRVPFPESVVPGDLPIRQMAANLGGERPEIGLRAVRVGGLAVGNE